MARIVTLRSLRVPVLAIAIAFAGVVAAGSAYGSKPAVSAEHGSGDHGGRHAEQSLNLYHGILMAREDVTEPTLLWRPKGMQPPLLALFMNTALLFGLLYFVGRGGVASALRKRKLEIMRGMDEAAEVKRAAQQRLDDYERKLSQIEADIARVRKELREAGELERARVVEEARKRRDRMEREARLLIEQEFKAQREQLHREVVSAAVAAAHSTLSQALTVADQQRMIREYAGLIGNSATSLRGRV